MDQTVQMSTVQMSVPTKDKLRLIADHYRRSMAGQVDWMVDQVYADLVAQGLVPEIGAGQPEPVAA